MRPDLGIGAALAPPGGNVRVAAARELDLGNAALVVGMGYLAIRPPMLHDALTNRRGDSVLSSTARVGTNGAATPAS
jgi:hypothetical protein